MEASTPEVCSRAETLSNPSASTWKVTRMRAAPATIGGMPFSSKRASERQSETSSRSPCTTWKLIPVCPRSEEHTSELQSLAYFVCRLLLEKKKTRNTNADVLTRTCPHISRSR